MNLNISISMYGIFCIAAFIRPISKGSPVQSTLMKSLKITPKISSPLSNNDHFGGMNQHTPFSHTSDCKFIPSKYSSNKFEQLTLRHAFIHFPLLIDVSNVSKALLEN